MGKIVPKNILIIKYRALGDSVIGTAAVSYLRSLYPDAHIVYGMPKWIAPLYEHTKTDADDILGFNLNSLADWWQLGKQLRQLEIDTVIELSQAGRTAKFFRLWSLLAGSQYFYHNHHVKNGSEVHDQGVIKPVIQRDLDGLWSHFTKNFKDMEASPLPSYLDWQPTINVDNSNKKDQVVMGVVATRQTKMWNLANYIALAKKIRDAHPQLDIVVPLSKSPTDEKIKQKLQQAPVSIIQEDLNHLPELLSGSLYYIGNDTGLKHLCAALGIKTFTLFGPEPPLEWHPYNEQKHPYFYINDLECRTKNAHYCGLSVCDSMICLKDISVNDVYSQVFSG